MLPTHESTRRRASPRERGSFEGVLTDAMSRRPLQPKSLIMTIFGDSVVPRGGVIWLGSIVALASQFGFAEPLVRTSALRLANDGWLLRQQRGKRSFYAMTDLYAAADAAYQSQIYSTSEQLRRNGWTIFRMLADRLDRRTVYQLKNALGRYGFGQLAPQVFIHPSIAKSATRHIISSSSGGGDPGVAFFSQDLEPSGETLRQLTDAAWDLSEIKDGYDDFIATFEAIPSLLDKRTPTPPVAFALRTLMVHQFRRLALRDPRLPETLLPARWPGEAAYQLISHSYRRFLPASETHLDEIFHVDGGRTPAADVRLFDRFSGAA